MGKLSPRVSAEAFVRIWNTASTIGEVAAVTGYTRGSVHAKAAKLRRSGHELKYWAPSRKGKNKAERRYRNVAMALSKAYLESRVQTSAALVAAETGFNVKTVARHAKKHGVTFAGAKRARTFDYDDSFKAYVDGLLFSDGSLQKRKSGLRKSFHQVSVNRDWLEEIKLRFEAQGIVCRWGNVRRIEGSRPQHSLNTWTYLTWLDWAERWYTEEGREVPTDLVLCPEFLRNHYLGDGSMSSVLVLCTEGFPIDDVERYAELLRGEFPSVYTRPLVSGQLRVYVRARDRNRLFTYIGGVGGMPPSMRNKIVYSTRYPLEC